MTLVTYVPGSALGFLLLEPAGLDGFDIGTSPRLTSATDAAFGWAVDLLQGFLPGWALFPVGLAILLAGFAAVRPGAAAGGPAPTCVTAPMHGSHASGRCS